MRCLHSCEEFFPQDAINYKGKMLTFENLADNTLTKWSKLVLSVGHIAIMCLVM